MMLRSSKELLLTPIVIPKSENEQVLIEASINSVRLSIKIKQVGVDQFFFTKVIHKDCY